MLSCNKVNKVGPVHGTDLFFHVHSPNGLSSHGQAELPSQHTLNANALEGLPTHLNCECQSFSFSDSGMCGRAEQRHYRHLIICR